MYVHASPEDRSKDAALRRPKRVAHSRDVQSSRSLSCHWTSQRDVPTNPSAHAAATPVTL